MLNQKLIPQQAGTEPATHNTMDMGSLFHDLQPISLARTNELASMQSRIDNKYLVNLEQFGTFLKLIAPEYAVLEIDGKRQFTYQSCYYDDQFRCYFEHHQGRRQRLKVRTRKYVDGGGMKYLEIKLKGARGLTIKHRSETESLVIPRVEGEQLGMLREIYARQYKKAMHLDLKPALLVGYKRCTMVALKGGERVTVDYGLNFAKPEADSTAVQLGNDFIVIETKSGDGKGIADQALKQLNIRQASRCSKYCIGVNLTRSVTRNNNFLAMIRRARQNITLTEHAVLASTGPLALVSQRDGMTPL